MQQMPFVIQKILSGFGYGNSESTITVRSDETELIAKLDSVLNSPSLLVPLSKDDSGAPVQDDGCGDGRMCSQTYTHEYRAKVFGGGLTMATATLVGLGTADADSEIDIFRHADALLNERHLDFGAHTDDGAQAPNSGCGAIDKFPQILAASVTYQQQIAASIASLGINTAGLSDVLQHFATYAAHHAADPYSGQQVSAEIIKEGKIVKQLTGEHIEKAVVLNTVAGYTTDQVFVYNEMDGKAEVFAVDVWRMQELADTLYDTPEERSHAFLSQLVYTLATAAVLTRGNLPVYLATGK